MDPFVIIDYNGVKYKTCVVQGGGKKPIWNDKFELEVHSMGDVIRVSCFDEDIWYHDLVGEATITVSHLCELQATRKWLPVKYKG